MTDTAATDVIFRRWPKREGGDVIALFPGDAGNVGQLWTCSSYQRIGQHSAASVDLVNETKPAREDEPDVRELKTELERIGYRLRVVKRMTQRHYNMREEQCRR